MRKMITGALDVAELAHCRPRYGMNSNCFSTENWVDNRGSWSKKQHFDEFDSYRNVTENQFGMILNNIGMLFVLSCSMYWYMVLQHSESMPEGVAHQSLMLL